MSWDNDRYHIVFNGEIYNYRELRRELEHSGETFRSQSDTEVVLALYALEWPGMFARLRGMYAMAIWDDLEHRLVLARDPYGIKPLYYAVAGGYLRFASQVKALEAGGALPLACDPAGVVGFLMWGSVPEPFTIRRAIRSVPAGHCVFANRDGIQAPVCYYAFGQPTVPEKESVETAVADSVRAHLVSDVPVAVFLSAGLDSSLLAASACRYLTSPLTTLTLRFDGFSGSWWDEGPVAAATARALGTRHVERRVGLQELAEMHRAALNAMDQPSVDGINTYIVSKVAHDEGLKVVLSGLGGDELFGSYPSFRDVPRWMRWCRVGRRVPGLAAAWPSVSARLRPSQPKLTGMLRYGKGLHGAYYLRRGLFLPEELPGILGRELAAAGLEAYDPVASIETNARAWTDSRGATPPDAWETVHALESTQYLRNQLLRDADWASMAHSLEIRVPFVDAWLREQLAGFGFEPARSLSKAELVRRLAPELPSTVWRRPKSGFLIPVAQALGAPSGMARRPGGGLDSRLLARLVLERFGVPMTAT
jgi:asparagine synthase (glutamine-hydrolysing)